MIPVIDLFAGPGGLGEGFSALRLKGKPAFRLALSIEKDRYARETLRLRSFFRQFDTECPPEYYDFLRGTTTLETLCSRFPVEAAAADEQAWLATLGDHKNFPIEKIDERIERALDGNDEWLLIGGPPCQAYSLVGRSRMTREREKYERDDRHVLYREYLRIIAVHRPPVFVMENVKGILSSRLAGSLIIDRILSDLRAPCKAIDGNDLKRARKQATYVLYPLADYGQNRSLFREDSSDASGYVIRCERHGIPQARHRLILLGVRSDIEAKPHALPLSDNGNRMWTVIRDLPRLRSRLSRQEDTAEAWLTAVREIVDTRILDGDGIDLDVWRKLKKTARKLKSSTAIGGEFVLSDARPNWQRKWFYDPKLGGACNHSTRSHMKEDLWRYFFAACYAQVHDKSPLLTDFPAFLLPNHGNAKGWEDEEDEIFTDRFRVQVKDRPSTTVTAHIAKDGHFFIHPDPLQCRSLTVREAARLQTFPDNYLFMGPRTAQYQQVGNAVPPLLARKLAGIVLRLMKESILAK